jgi:TonB family protein
MRIILPAIGLLVLSAGLLSAQEPAENRSDALFRGPEVSEAGQLYGASATFVTGIGIVVLEPTISAEGNVESVEVIRSTPGMPGMEAEAIQGVKTWKFRPAVINGKPSRSRTTVVAVFNQCYNVPPAISLPPLAEHQGVEDRQKNEDDVNLPDFSPALPTDVVIPEYPVMSVLTTTVVLRVELESTGDIHSVSPLHEVAAFSPRAVAAVKKWKFSPATSAEQPAPSKVTVAIFFAPAHSALD